MNIREQFEQEMAGKLQPLLKELDAPFIKQKYVSEYVQWLENKVAQKPEVSEGDLENARMAGYKDGYEAGDKNGAFRIANNRYTSQ